MLYNTGTIASPYGDDVNKLFIITWCSVADLDKSRTPKEEEEVVGNKK
jgi:hypothetical protein